jgi:hypothetical protein
MVAKERKDRDQRSGTMKPTRSGRRQAKSAPDAALLLWLDRGLHTMFDGIEQEPLPPQMIELVEKDRNRS